MNVNELTQQFPGIWDEKRFWDTTPAHALVRRDNGDYSYWDKESREIYIKNTVFPDASTWVVIAVKLGHVDGGLASFVVLSPKIHDFKLHLAHCTMAIAVPPPDACVFGDQDSEANGHEIVVYQSTILSEIKPELFRQRIALLKENIKQAEAMLHQIPQLMVKQQLPPYKLTRPERTAFTANCESTVTAFVGRRRALVSDMFSKTVRPLSEGGFRSFVIFLMSESRERDTRPFSSMRQSTMDVKRFDREDTLSFWHADHTEVAVTRLRSGPGNDETVTVYAKACRCLIHGIQSADWPSFHDGLEKFAPLVVELTEGSNVIVRHDISITSLSGQEIASQVAAFWKCLDNARAYFQLLEKTGMNGHVHFEVVKEKRRAIPESSFWETQERRLYDGDYTHMGNDGHAPGGNTVSALETTPSLENDVDAPFPHPLF
ncbi:hypothetical protein JOE11_003089 [Robbsia andropogonis]|uniref:hypothetical protein n=2 Tax=Robbsia andropogonis TaxID=28092 RepID=UPI00158F63E4|nr:hypothetical protein [Robbsia andropogonis]MCP1128720.1 hypothetical protein [Robbsia andropogonis]